MLYLVIVCLILVFFYWQKSVYFWLYVWLTFSFVFSQTFTKVFFACLNKHLCIGFTRLVTFRNAKLFSMWHALAKNAKSLLNKITFWYFRSTKNILKIFLPLNPHFGGFVTACFNSTHLEVSSIYMQLPLQLHHSLQKKKHKSLLCRANH